MWKTWCDWNCAIDGRNTRRGLAAVSRFRAAHALYGHRDTPYIYRSAPPRFVSLCFVHRHLPFSMPASLPTAALRTRLSSHLALCRFDALRDHLLALRNAEFRAASVVLAEANFWTSLSDEAFWSAFRTLCRADSRAFLGTLLKAAVGRRKHGGLQWTAPDFLGFCREDATAIDRRKMLEALLPLASTPEEAESLLGELWHREEGEKVRAAQLFRAATSATYFLLFKTLRHFEDDKNYLRRVALELMRRGDKAAFNLAGMLREYFALGELPGTFALQLPPYELSRLDSRYDAFLKILNR